MFDITDPTSSMVPPKYLEVLARVRYWEDAYLNGVADFEGTMPLRKGDDWAPVIDLDTGHVLGWPQGLEASIHYKVCDAGEYWLLDTNKKRMAKWDGYYVPDRFLCVGDEGHGDYIIFSIGPDGLIENWKKPLIDASRWTALAGD